MQVDIGMRLKCRIRRNWLQLGNAGLQVLRLRRLSFKVSWQFYPLHFLHQCCYLTDKHPSKVFMAYLSPLGISGKWHSAFNFSMLSLPKIVMILKTRFLVNMIFTSIFFWLLEMHNFDELRNICFFANLSYLKFRAHNSIRDLKQIKTKILQG